MVVFVQITSGVAVGPYIIYYDSVSPSNIAQIIPTLLPATNITLTDLQTGIDVKIPDSSSSLILYNTTCGISIPYIFPTATPTPTPTSQSPTPTPTPTITPSITPSPNIVMQFQDCQDGSKIFRFGGNGMPILNLGDVYFITNSNEYYGCASVIANTGSGFLYNSNGVSFTLMTGCGDTTCPTSSIGAAQLQKCSDGSLHYFLVDLDTALSPGLTYFYLGECYSLIALGGIIAGPYIGSPAFSKCSDCVPTRTPTPTPNPTPTNTPTPSTTPLPCDYDAFCLNTTLSGLSAYSGTYSSTTLNYNSRLYYTGDGTTIGYIFHTGINWCLSNTLGGTCLLEGAIPCYSSCPDLSKNIFTSGVCPPLPPTPPSCDILDFVAYFDCDFVPPSPPSPPIDCEDVGFDFENFLPTPTPTPTRICATGLDFGMSSFTPSNLVTPTPTQTPTNKNNQVGGIVTYEFVDKVFSCASVKVLVTQTGQELYTSDALRINGLPIVIGTTFLANVNGTSLCLTYVRDDDNISSNITINNVIGLDCNVPEPTRTPTPTQLCIQPGWGEKLFNYSYNVLPSVVENNFTASFSSACNAIPFRGTGYQVNRYNATAASFTIGNLVYNKGVSQGCVLIPDGFYITNYTTQEITQVQNGVIVSVQICNAPSSTPTPTPQITPSPTPTSGVSPTPTRTNTATPTRTSSPTPSSNFVYVYESCQPIVVGSTQRTRVIQTTPVNTNTDVFKGNGYCWRFIGRFNSGYISPSGFREINYTGNYFGLLTVDYGSCSTCLAPPPPPPGCCTLLLTIELLPSIQVDTELFFSYRNCQGRTVNGSTGVLTNNRGSNRYTATISNFREGTLNIPISTQSSATVQSSITNCVGNSVAIAVP